MRALGMRKRKTTFPFDLLKIEMSHDGCCNERTVKLVRDTSMTPEGQAQAYMEHLGMYFNRLGIKGIEVVTERHKCEYVECDNCYTGGLVKGVAVGADLYDTPWETKAKVRHFCSYLCLDSFTRAYDGGDFAYVTCSGCCREICQQNPSNGYHWQFRYDEKSGEDICLKCYESDLMEHGHPRERIEGNQCPGMFHDRNELIDAGWIKEGEYFLRSYVGTDCQRNALSLIDKGNIVIVNWERIGMGLEGSVSLWYKPIKTKVTVAV